MRSSAPEGYSGTPLGDKLGIKPGSTIFTAGAPSTYRKLIHPVPGDVRFVSRLNDAVDIIHLFVNSRRTLAKALPAYRRRMRPDAVIWISWPKKSSGVETDLSEDGIRELALPLDLVDIKVCAVDATWSGLKLMIRKDRRVAGSRRS
jgi:hypothetical protein